MIREEDFPAELINLGKWLRNGRLGRDLTQKELAERCGIAQPRISGIEKGEILPTLPQLLRLARGLGLPLQWFLTCSTRPGKDIPKIALELHALGIVDLLIPNAVVPGAFRAAEEIIALAVSGDQPETRIIEAIPAVLAWNSWSHVILRAYSQASDPRAGFRLAWLADVALTIERTDGFPGGCLHPRELEVFIRWWYKRLPSSRADDLGRPATGTALPPVSKRWKITYDAPLSAFAERARHLHSMRAELATTPLT